MFVYKIIGSVTGGLWMGGRGYKEVEFNFLKSEKRPFLPSYDSLRDAVESLVDDGDFQGTVKLTADSVLRVDWHRKTRTVTRFFPLSGFGSISEHMDSEPLPEEWLHD